MGRKGERERNRRNFEVIMDVNFSKFMIDNKAQDQKYPRIPNKINIKNDYI